MRLLFGLLVVVNVAIFYFGSQWKSDDSKKLVATLAPDVGQLRLLSEIEKNKPAAEPEVSIPSYEVVVDKSTDEVPVVQESSPEIEEAPLTEPIEEVLPLDQPEQLIVDQLTPEEEAVPVTDIPEDPTLADQAAEEPSAPPVTEEIEPEVTVAPPVERLLNDTEPAPVRDVDVGKEELEQASVGASEEQLIVEPPAEAKQVCGAIGAFAEGAEGRETIAYLENAGVEASLRREEVEKASGFWVIIPAYPNQDEARKAVERLRSKGIKDFRMFFKGDRKNSISLGLFSREANAERRRVAILKKGEKAVIEPRISKVEEFWVDFRGDSHTQEEAVKALLKRYPELKRDEYPCSRIVTNGGIF